MRNIYLIKDLSRLSGYSVHTIKYYIQRGLLEEIGRGPETNYRYFDDTTVNQLKEITRLKAQGLKLADIAKKMKS